jgi:hypothetical protein
VTVRGADRAATVGFYYGQVIHTVAESWKDGTWKVRSTEDPGSNSQLYGVEAVPGTATMWAVGGYSTRGFTPLIERYC